MTRQNGVVLLPVTAVTLSLAAAYDVPRKTAAFYGAGFLLVTSIVTVGGDAVLAARGDGGYGARLELRNAQSYDLIGALRRDPALTLARLKRVDPGLEQLMRQRGVPRYSTRLIDTVMADAPLANAIERAPDGAIFAQWRDLVLIHPALYLATRWPVFWQVLATPDVMACHPLFLGVDGDPETMKILGLQRRWTFRDAALARYASGFIGSPLFSHLVFAALAVASMIWLLRRRTAANLAVAGLLAGALIFALTFLIVSVACDYRYLYFLDLAALTGAFHAARAFTFP